MPHKYPPIPQHLKAKADTANEVLTMCDAVKHVKYRVGRSFTRQTLYNWTKGGKLGRVLQTVVRDDRMHIRRAELDSFLEETGLW